MLFHSKIYEIAGNNFILQLHEITHPILVFVKQNYDNYFLPVNEQLSENREIISHPDLLFFNKSRDKEGYQKAMPTHLKPYWEFIHNFDIK